MWPGCTNCGAPVPDINDQYCGGGKCVGKATPFRQSPHSQYTKKKVTKQMIKARRKKGRR